MRTAEIYSEVKEINLAYLMLAQQMLRHDRDAAIFRLGVGEEVADVIESLTPGQVLRMASSNTLLCRFRFDDRLIFDLLASHERDTGTARLHAAILAADASVEALA